MTNNFFGEDTNDVEDEGSEEVEDVDQKQVSEDEDPKEDEVTIDKDEMVKSINDLDFNLGMDDVMKKLTEVQGPDEDEEDDQEEFDIQDIEEEEPSTEVT